jgi:GNAT superfamily N-acetyltransferase
VGRGRSRVEVLTADRLVRLPDPCRGCLFWETGGPRPIDIPTRTRGVSAEKLAWWRDRESEDETVLGRIIEVDGGVAAWAMVGPGTMLTRWRRSFPPPGRDALLITTLWVEPEHRGRGLGRLLVRAVLKEALDRDLRGVEAYGDRRPRDGGCVLPGTWLLHVGFAVDREHPRYPLLRIDTRSTVRLLEPLEQMVGHARERLSPRPEPVTQPIGR